jgi:hypothetical protein
MFFENAVVVELSKFEVSLGISGPELRFSGEMETYSETVDLF